MPNKYEGIYLMSVCEEAISEERHRRIAGQGLQQLVNSDRFFNLLWNQARAEHPAFHEGQLVRRHDQPPDLSVSRFKEWLQAGGVVVEEDRWDSHFFHTSTPDQDAPGSSSELYVYLNATGAEVMEPALFIVDYTLAARAGNVERLQQLLSGTVRCQTCERVVDPAIRATKQGFLGCPFCGQWWTKPVEERQAAATVS